MKCQHLRHGIFNSRPMGTRKAKREKFEYVRHRRVKCFDCDSRWDTFEMTREQIDHAHAANHQVVLSELRGLIAQMAVTLSRAKDR